MIGLIFFQPHYRKELGDEGELLVLRDLETKGWDVRRMPTNNPGYDIEATNTNSGEIIYVEVKGESWTWCDKGVGISSKQYQTASDNQESFVLAIVENLRQPPQAITYLKDPVSYITEYRFDDGWRELASNISIFDQVDSSEPIHLQLCSHTDSETCKKLIMYCHERDYPLPEVGVELIDETGRVNGVECELAWEDEKIGVIISGINIEPIEGWDTYTQDEMSEVERYLDEKFEV